MAEPKIAGTHSIKLDLQPGTYYWCTCGESAGQPWCDGSHGDTDFIPLELTIEEPRRCSLCTCKRTLDPPFCDHAHRELPGYVPKDK